MRIFMKNFEFELAYRPSDEITREQVPETYEEGHKHGSDLRARSQGNNHHPIH